MHAKTAEICKAASGVTVFVCSMMGETGIGICCPDAVPSGPPHPATQLIKRFTNIPTTQ